MKRQIVFKMFKEIFRDTCYPYPVDPKVLSEKTQHLLSAYIDAELDGQDAAVLFPDVHKALTEYPEFAQEYRELSVLLDAERRGELEEPPHIPEFDFSYLLKNEDRIQ